MSTNHITDEVPRMLTGEASHDVVVAAAAHLRSCPDCQQELVSAVVAHAALSSAQRFAPEIVARHESVGDSLGLDIGAATGRAGAHAARDDDAGPDLPPMTDMFARIRDEAAANERRVERAPKRRRLLAVAAAAVILGGGGVTLAETVGSSSSSTTHTVALHAFDRGTNPASVTIVDDRTLRVDATKLPKLDSSHVYELWMTDAGRRKMQSVGLLGTDNRGTLTVPSKSLSRFTDFEVSVQRTDQTKYSNISVLRGSYS